MAEKADSAPEKEQAGDGTGLDDALSQALHDFGSEQSEPSEEQASEVEADAGAEQEGSAEGEAETGDKSESDEAGEKTPSDEGEDTGEESEEETAQKLDPPEDWRQDQKEAFGKLDREAQDLVLQQYKDFQKGFTQKSQELSDEARYAQEVRRVFDETGLRSQLQQAGMTDVDAVRRLAGAHLHLQSTPQEALRSLAKQYNVDLEALAFGDDGSDSSSAEPSDPKVAQLEKQVGSLQSYLQQQQAAQQQTEQQRLNTQIEEFAQAQDDQGNAKHPHFDKVSDKMAALIQQGQAKDLNDAYEQAVWLDPEIRQQQIEAERKRVADEEARKRKEAADKAKKAGRNPRGNTGNAGNAKPQGLDSILEDAIAQHES